MLKRFFAAICAAMLVLTGCGSDYSDAQVEVPANWAEYTVGNMEFRFEAGWKGGNWDSVLSDADTQAQLIGTNNNLALFGRLVAPTSAQDTTNYVDFGYWEIGRQVETSELEALMDPINDLLLEIKKTGIESNDLQASRIRFYGEVEALTCSYIMEKEKVECIMQMALVPQGSKVYFICLSDFTSGEDNSMLEQLLSTLSINN